jgi:hypothetical protein
LEVYRLAKTAEPKENYLSVSRSLLKNRVFTKEELLEMVRKVDQEMKKKEK